MNVEGGKFACDACGKRYAWKSQLAGKRAKCSCGAMMVVPHAEAAAEPEDLYGFAEDQVPAGSVAKPMPMAAPAAASVATAIGYRSAPTKENTARDRFSFDEMTHPPRDLYIPIALIVLGLLGILAWASHLGLGPGLIAVVSIASGTATVIKTALLILAAFMIAPVAGVSFGDVRTAILKFAAIVIFTDAAGLWFDEALESVGEIKNDKQTIRSLFWGVLFTAALISALCYYLFDMDGEETGTFAVPFAIVSHLAGFVLNLIVLGLIGALTSAATAPPAPAVATPGTAAPATATPQATSPQAAPGIPLQTNARDREIERMIGSGLGVKDANDYNQSQPQKSKREPQLVAQFYGAGAKRVYFDLGGSSAIVQLPDESAGRAKCFEVAVAHRAAKGIDGANVTEQGQRYLEVELDKPTGRSRTR